MTRWCALAFGASWLLTFASEAAPPGELTLAEACSLAVARHPRIAASGWDVRAQEAGVAAAGKRPNPELSIDVENVAGTSDFRGLEGAETTVALSHTFELGGKRSNRVEVARGELGLAERDAEFMRAAVLAEVAQAYVVVLHEQERVALVDSLIGIAQHVLEAVSRRVTAGGVSPVEERRARVALDVVRLEREGGVRALTAARERLAATWAADGSSFEFARELPDAIELPPLERLLSRVEDSPRLARFDGERTRALAEGALATSVGTPDLALSGGVRRIHESDDTTWLVGLSVPLPIFDRNRDAAEAARHRARRIEDERRATAIELRSALRDAHGRAALAQQEWDTLHDQILPEAETAFTESREAYERGRLRLTDVLDAERAVFELRLRSVDVRAAARAVRFEIDTLLGVPPGDEFIQQEDGRDEADD